MTYKEHMLTAQRGYFDFALRRFRGNVMRVSIYAGMDRASLYKLFVTLAIKPEDYRKKGVDGSRSARVKHDVNNALIDRIARKGSEDFIKKILRTGFGNTRQ